jgi:chromosome segregation ATPase
MLIFGYSEKEMENARKKAQRDMVDDFEDGIRHGHDHQRGREVLIELLYDLSGYRATYWIRTLPEKLVALVDRLVRKNTDLERNLKNERRQRKQFERELEDYRRDPLQKQVRTLTKECNQWCDEATRLGDRVRRLERDLDRCQQRYRNETQQCQKRLTELNSLVVRQQERLQSLRE